MTKLTDVLKKNTKKIVISFLKSLPLRIERKETTFITLVYTKEQPTIILIWHTGYHIPIVFHNLSGYDAYLFIKKQRKKFSRDHIEDNAENKEKYISLIVELTSSCWGDQ